MRCDPTTHDASPAERARALLAAEFGQALAHDLGAQVSTPGYTLRDTVEALTLVEHILANEDDNHTLGQLMRVCVRMASSGDMQAAAVLQSLAVRFAADQVVRMVECGAIPDEASHA